MCACACVCVGVYVKCVRARVCVWLRVRQLKTLKLCEKKVSFSRIQSMLNTCWALTSTLLQVQQHLQRDYSTSRIQLQYFRAWQWTNYLHKYKSGRCLQKRSASEKTGNVVCEFTWNHLNSQIYDDRSENRRNDNGWKVIYIWNFNQFNGREIFFILCRAQVSSNSKVEILIWKRISQTTMKLITNRVFLWLREIASFMGTAYPCLP